MTRPVFETIVASLGIAFAIAFGVVVVPPLLDDPDILGAFAAGFVNPYASGYATDALLCAAILFAWVAYERRTASIRHGWVAVPLAFAPGVATAFAFYLVLRSRQLGEREPS